MDETTAKRTHLRHVVEETGDEKTTRMMLTGLPKELNLEATTGPTPGVNKLSSVRHGF